MKEMTLEKMQKKLQKYMDNERYTHTLGVMYTAASLAMCYGEDMQKALIAGLLHDSAKCIPNNKKIKLCNEHHIPITDSEQQSPYLLHAKLGAYIAHKKYGIQDRAILDAIRYHTTGRPNMTLLDKIVYMADYMEPMRCKADNLGEVRKMAFQDLDEALYIVLRDTLKYLDDSNDRQSVDPMTKEAYDYYKQKFEH